MAKRKNTDGYYVAKFNVNKKSKSIAIHILVARHFIPNPDNLPEVNHLDCNRTNNRADNLEWSTHIDNIRYSSEKGRYKGRTGEKNPNWHNTTLKERYKANPGLAKQLLARPREQNGRCIPIRLHYKDITKDFKFMGEAAEYLIQNQIVKSKKVSTVRERIRLSLKNNIPYLNCTFEKI